MNLGARTAMWFTNGGDIMEEIVSPRIFAYCDEVREWLLSLGFSPTDSVMIYSKDGFIGNGYVFAIVPNWNGAGEFGLIRSGAGTVTQFVKLTGTGSANYARTFQGQKFVVVRF